MNQLVAVSVYSVDCHCVNVISTKWLPMEQLVTVSVYSVDCHCVNVIST